MNVTEVATRPVQRPGGLGREGGRTLSRSAAVVVALTIVGVVFRVAVAHQSMYADELATYWLVTTRGFGGVISALYSTHDEITPPLSFLAFWITAHISHAPEVFRLPSLLAGTLTIPLVYLLGLKTVGRSAAIVATALTTLSPFMIYYSTEARAYGLLMFFVVLSTLAMLQAIDTRRARWWVLYAASSGAAFYAHYSCAFVLGAQFLWLVWKHPEARRPALLANVGAVAVVLPWTGGLVNDFNSPTTKILSVLSPFTPHAVWLGLQGWAVGYPFIASVGLSELPGTVALVLLGCGTLLAAVGIASRFHVDRWKASLTGLDNRVLLVFGLALATPVGEAIFSSVSTHLFGVRNLASSWPTLGLAFAFLLLAAGRRLRLAAVALVIASFAIGAVKMLDQRYSRPNYQAAADYIARQARPGDVVVDETGVISPGPLTPLDIALKRRIDVVRAGAPAEHDHPFGLFDPIVPLPAATRFAAALANGHRIFGVIYPRHEVTARLGAGFKQRAALVQNGGVPAGYQIAAVRNYSGIVNVTLVVYARRTHSS